MKIGEPYGLRQIGIEFRLKLASSDRAAAKYVSAGAENL